MRSEKKYVGMIAALLIGVAYMFVLHIIPALAGGGWLDFYLPAIFLLLPAMLLLALYSDKRPWLNLAYFFSGVVIAISADALLFHPKVTKIAWLFACIGCSLFLAPIAVLATALGVWITRRRKRPGKEARVDDEGATP